DLANPSGCLAVAQQLAAQAYKAKHAFFLINGTTSGIHTMLLSTLNRGDVIVMPRDAHKSLFAGLILSGATPGYANVKIDEEPGFCLPPAASDYEVAIEKSSKPPRAVFSVNPSYFGLCPDVSAIGNI